MAPQIDNDREYVPRPSDLPILFVLIMLVGATACLIYAAVWMGAS